jgi:cyclopropane fatty-acyl-phospholipid synthase-like methyltransferase
LGCGTGTNVITLAKHGWEVVGIDFIPKAIRIANRKGEKEGIKARFLVSDVTKPCKLQEKFQLILDIGCYHTLSKKGKEIYRENLSRLLEDDGIYLIYLRTRSNENFHGAGVVSDEIKPLENIFELINIKDGAKPGIHSSWLTFRNTKRL